MIMGFEDFCNGEGCDCQHIMAMHQAVKEREETKRRYYSRRKEHEFFHAAVTCVCILGCLLVVGIAALLR